MKNYLYSERVNLFEPNVYINFLMEISGNPKTDDVIDAVKVAFAANEATLSKIMIEKNGDACYVRQSESGCKVVLNNDNWYDIMRENEKIPFAINQGELMRVFVIHSEDKVLLFIMAHHLVGDGKSIVYFIENVMKALSGGSLEYTPMQLITKDSLTMKLKLPIFFRLYIKVLNKNWKQTGRTFHWGEYYEIHKAYWKEHSSQIVYECFSPEELSAIHMHAKEIGVTVNSYILAAFLEADRDNHTIGIAVNARMNGNKSMSNQATGISVHHTYRDQKTFDKNAQLIHRKVQYKLSNPVMKYFILKFMPLFKPSLVDSVLLYTYGIYRNKTTQKLSKVLGYTGNKTREIGITNLTQLDIPNHYGMYGIKNGLFVPPIVSYAKHIIGVSSMDSGMTISYHYMSSQEKEKELAFFQRAIQNMRNNI